MFSSIWQHSSCCLWRGETNAISLDVCLSSVELNGGSRHILRSSILHFIISSALYLSVFISIRHVKVKKKHQSNKAMCVWWALSQRWAVSLEVLHVSPGCVRSQTTSDNYVKLNVWCLAWNTMWHGHGVWSWRLLYSRHKSPAPRWVKSISPFPFHLNTSSPLNKKKSGHTLIQQWWLETKLGCTKLSDHHIDW